MLDRRVEGKRRVIVPLTTGKSGIDISDRGRRGRRGSGMSLVVALRGRDLAGRITKRVSERDGCAGFACE